MVSIYTAVFSVLFTAIGVSLGAYCVGWVRGVERGRNFYRRMNGRVPF